MVGSHSDIRTQDGVEEKGEERELVAVEKQNWWNAGVFCAAYSPT